MSKTPKNHAIKAKVLPESEMKTQTRKLVKVVQEQIFWSNEPNENGEWVGEKYSVAEFIDKDFNFEKIWLVVILQMLGLIGNAKVKVAMWLLKNRNSDNYVFANLRKIANECGASFDTVQRTLKVLKDNKLLAQFNKGGVYQINPDMIFKGGSNKRMNLILKFKSQIAEMQKNDLEIKEQKLPPFQKDLSLKDKIKNDIKQYQNNIKKLQFKLRTLNILVDTIDDFEYDITQKNLYFEIDEEKRKLDNAWHTLEYLRDNNY